MTSTAAKPARDSETETAVVTKMELIELREWEDDFAKWKKKVAEAERKLKALRPALIEKVLGLKMEELKKLPLEKVQKLFARRQANGDFELQKGAPVFAFDQTSSGRYPAWKDLFTAEMGEAAAAKITDETDPTYSYRIEVASPL